MKKVSLLIIVFTLLLSMTPVHASNSIEKVRNELIQYYKNKKTITSFDELIAMESLHVETENKKLNPIKKSNTPGYLSKAVIAYKLKGNSYTQELKQLEKFINKDGTIKQSYGISLDIWVLIALYVGHSKFYPNVLSRINHLKSNVYSSKDYYDNTKTYEDIDTAGLVLETLSILKGKTWNTYTYLTKQKIRKKQYDIYYNHSYENVDSQALALEGLAVYKKSSISKQALNYLLSYYQGKAKVKTSYDPNYARNDFARSIGVYSYGSWIDKAYKEKIKQKKTYSIKATSITSLKYGYKTIYVNYKKIKGITGYEIAFKQKSKKKWYTYKAKTNHFKMIRLKRKTAYQIKVRTYKKIKNKNYYSHYSKVKVGYVR